MLEMYNSWLCAPPPQNIRRIRTCVSTGREPVTGSLPCDSRSEEHNFRVYLQRCRESPRHIRVLLIEERCPPDFVLELPFLSFRSVSRQTDVVKSLPLLSVVQNSNPSVILSIGIKMRPGKKVKLKTNLSNRRPNIENVWI